jgi:hypothetical protein
VQWRQPKEEPFRDGRPFAAEVRRRAPPPEEVLFFRTEAHAVAFRVGRPLAVLVEWDELRARLAGPGVRYVVAPPAVAEEARRELPGVRFEEVLSNTDLTPDGRHEHPLTLLRAEERNAE